jgi:PAS domain S-box-containing protein
MQETFAPVLFDSMSEGFIGLDAELVIRCFNAAARRFLGKSQEEAQHRPLFDVFPAMRGNIFEEKYRLALAERKPMSFDAFYDTAGLSGWYRVRAIPVEGGLGVFVSVITREIEAREDADREARLNAAVAACTEALINVGTDIDDVAELMLDHAKVTSGARDGLVASLDNDQGELLVHSITPDARGLLPGGASKIVPDSAGVYEGLIGHCLTSREAFYTNDPAEYAVSLARCECRNFLAVPALAGDRLYGVIALANRPGAFSRRDVEDVRKLARLYALALRQKQLAEMLQSSEERYRILFMHSPDAFYINDLKGRLVDGNIAAEKISGYEKRELIGRNMLSLGLLPKKYIPRAAANLLKNMRGIGTGPDEFELRSKRGDCIDVEIHTHVVTLSGKRMVLGVARDISERKRFQRELDQQREMLQTVINAIPVMLTVHDPDDGFVLVNREVERVLGWTVHDLRDRDPMRLCFETEKERRAVRAFMNAAHPGEWMDQLMLTREGERAETSWTNVELSDGRRIGIGLDISAIRRTERALKESERKYRQLVESLQEGIWAFDADGRTMFVNDSMCAMLGVDKKGVIDTQLTDFMDERGLHAAGDTLEENWSKDRWEMQLELIRGDGARVFMRIVAGTMRDEHGKRSGTLASVTDVTEQWIMQRVLEANERKYRTLFETMMQGVVYQNEAGDIIAANRAAQEMLELNLDRLHQSKLVTERWRAVREDGSSFSPDEHPSMIALRTGIKVENEIIGLTAGEGRRRWVLVNAIPQFRDGDTRPYQVYSTFTDISALKYAEDSIRVYERAIESLQDAVTAIDREYRYIFVNNAFLRRYGFRRAHVIGRPVSAVLGEAAFARTREHIDQCFEGRRIEFDEERDLPGLGKRVVQTTYYPIARQQADIFGVTEIVRDITEARRAQDELQKTARLESLGMLAGGIAHDFNNLLGGLYGYIDMAREYGNPGPDARKYLDKAIGSYRRARDLTRQLLTFSKGGAPRIQTVAIASLVKDATALALSGSGIRLRFTAAHDLWPASVDEGQIGQVVNNIVLNSRQAFGDTEDAAVTVALSNAVLPEPNDHSIPGGKYVAVSISDNGPGMDPDIVAKIFDPFFSTKSGGSGLGLATSFSIIKRHHGAIEASAQPGNGAAFTIFLPAAVSCRAVVDGVNADDPVSGGNGRILVMDDEESIQEMLTDMLENLGYAITLTSDGREAIEAYRAAQEQKAPFDAVLLDLTVSGGMGGKSAIRELAALDPDVTAIVSSGYSEDPVLASPERFGFKGVVHKPYRLSDLARVLKELLQ